MTDMHNLPIHSADKQSSDVLEFTPKAHIPRPACPTVSKYAVYYIGSRTPEAVSDDLDQIEDAYRFADWLATYAHRSRTDFVVLATMMH